jgi:hypothetical protein
MPDIYFGGAEKQFRYIVDGLTKEPYNYRVVVVVVVGKWTKQINRLQDDRYVREHTNIRFIRLNSKQRLSSENSLNKILYALANYPKLYMTVKALISKEKYEAIIGYYDLYIPLVNMMRKYCSNVIFSERNAGESPIRYGLLKNYLNRFSKIVTNSRTAQRNIQSKLCHNSVVYIANGVEIDSLESASIHNSFNILVLGTYCVRKNQLNILKAIVKTDDSEINARFYGNIADKDYYNKCVELVHTARIGNRVWLNQSIGSDEINKQYSLSDLVILASFSEGTSNVIIESFSKRRLCIASSIPQNTDLFKDKAFLFDPNKPDEISNKIKMVKNMKPEERQREIEYNYECVKQNFCIDKMLFEFSKAISCSE